MRLFYNSDTTGTKVWRKCETSPWHPRLKPPSLLMVWSAFGFGDLAAIVTLKAKLSIKTCTWTSWIIIWHTRADQSGNIPTRPPATELRLWRNEWLTESETEVIPDWPGGNPDISVIENLWGIVKEVRKTLQIGKAWGSSKEDVAAIPATAAQVSLMAFLKGWKMWRKVKDFLSIPNATTTSS